MSTTSPPSGSLAASCHSDRSCPHTNHLVLRTVLLRRTAFFLLLLLVATTVPVDAQSLPDSTDYVSDSTDMTDLGVVVVTARRSSVNDLSVDNVVPRSDIQNTDGSDVASVMYEVPAARVQTNSRGEANLYLRNAGERQVAIFFDGALLNIPWDNRVDLSLLPANAVGGFHVSKGAPSVLYGANTMGGAVNIVTRQREVPGSMTVLELSGGSGTYAAAGAAHIARHGPLDLVGTLSYSRRDGVTLSEDADLAYSQEPGELRNNTDARNLGLFLRAGYSFDEHDRVGLSLNVVDGEKGIAPEGHLDPAVDRVRFWRYPAWRWINAISSYQIVAGEHDHLSLKGSTWATLFSQQIDQYQDSTYTLRTEQQEDEDFVIGSRLILSTEGERSLLSIGFNSLYARHDQVDSEVSTDDVVTSSPEQTYAQFTGSAGVEYRSDISDRVEVGSGVSLDLMSTLEADDKPKQSLYLQPGFTLGAMYQASPEAALGVSLGRKSRFPSMRELYGVALSRFLVNPDLQPESAYSLELEFAYKLSEARVALTPFAQLISNTIDQRNVEVNGNRLRQRINLEGSQIFGVEATGAASLTDWLRFNGHATWTHARSIEEIADGESFLSEKPAVVATFNLTAKGPHGTRFDLETRTVGVAYTLDATNSFVELPPATTVNVRASISLIGVGPTRLLEFWLRANNLLDAAPYNQLGLPEGGREFRAGIRSTL